jgi:simple sugar transport system substrate-binding protein
MSPQDNVPKAILPMANLPRIIYVGVDPGITFLDRRVWVFYEMVNQGKIEETAYVRLDDLDNPHSTAWETLAAVLPHFPPGSVDAVWVPWDEFASGCAEALAAAGRNDIKLFSIGISNETIHSMLRHPDIWLANTAVDLKLVGTAAMRILASALAGETLDDTFSFAPQLVKTKDLNFGVNINNISVVLPDWGDGTGLFDNYRWMLDLKTAVGRYLRISPFPHSAVLSGRPHEN